MDNDNIGLLQEIKQLNKKAEEVSQKLREKFDERFRDKIKFRCTPIYKNTDTLQLPPNDELYHAAKDVQPEWVPIYFNRTLSKKWFSNKDADVIADKVLETLVFLNDLKEIGIRKYPEVTVCYFNSDVPKMEDPIKIRVYGRILMPTEIPD